MIATRRLRLLGHLVEAGGAADMQQLCVVCAQVVGVDGAGITLLSRDVATGPVWTSDRVSGRLAELQRDLGEGPSVDADREERPIAEPDLADPAVSRWLSFSAPALEAGVCAVFAFPLCVGAARLGALDLYSTQPGYLSDEQHADALVMASIAAEVVLQLQAGAPPGTLATELQASGDFQYVVHQATGMVSAQLGTTVTEALLRLRARAYADGRSVTDLAREVVGRRLRFDDGDGDGVGKS